MQPRRKAAPHARQIRLKRHERRMLRSLTSRGRVEARVLKRVRILQLLDQGWAPTDVPAATGAGEATVRRVRRRYEEGGLEHAVYEIARNGAPRLLSDKQSVEIVAMVCSDPPAGRARWTIELAAREAVRRNIVERVGRETIRVLLRDHDLRPWREKNVVRRRSEPGVHRTNGGPAGAL